MDGHMERIDRSLELINVHMERGNEWFGGTAVILVEALVRGSDNAANSGLLRFSPRPAGAFSSANDRRVS
jgi:hypothetical protein